MKWIIEYWYIIAAGLAAAIFIFGYKGKGDREQTNDIYSEEHHEEKSHKDGHSCCH